MIVCRIFLMDMHAKAVEKTLRRYFFIEISFFLLNFVK